MKLLSSPTQELIYRIDWADRVCSVSADWEQFAMANDGEAVMPARVLRRPLWDFIQDINVCALYRQMIQRARVGFPAQFDYRCDAPEWRRQFQMTIRMSEGETVEFLSKLLWKEQRPRVELLDIKTRRSEHWVRVCGWCQKVALPLGSWVQVEEAVKELGLLSAEAWPMLTHGICPPCQSGMMAELEFLTVCPEKETEGG